MIKIKIIILEDNPITAADLKEILEKKDFQVLKVFKDAQSALLEIDQLDPDILLVDIYLRGKKSGIDFVSELNHHQYKPVIFLSGNTDEETINKAINTQPVAFLTKPFKEKDVQIAIELAMNHDRQFSGLDTPNQNQIKDALFLKTGTKYQKVFISNIEYLEASGSYCKVYSEQKEFLLSNNLNSYQAFFEDHGFVRIHRSFMINPTCVEQLNTDSVEINQLQLPIGRSYKQLVRDFFPRLS